MPVIMKIMSHADGSRSALDGKWVVEYDPTRPAYFRGRLIRMHLVITDNPAEARRFADPVEAHAYWTTPSGKPPPRNAPLTAYIIELETADEPSPATTEPAEPERNPEVVTTPAAPADKPHITTPQRLRDALHAAGFTIIPEPQQGLVRMAWPAAGQKPVELLFDENDPDYHNRVSEALIQLGAIAAAGKAATHALTILFPAYRQQP